MAFLLTVDSPTTVANTMADYVYAVHDFLPEHEDEISFKAGERIEVLERDDLYGDGWWQVSLTAPYRGIALAHNALGTELARRSWIVSQGLHH